MTGPRDPDAGYKDDTDELAALRDEVAALRDKVEVLKRENALLNSTMDQIADVIKQYS